MFLMDFTGVYLSNEYDVADDVRCSNDYMSLAIRSSKRNECTCIYMHA